jgi:hypothetical protein
MTSENNDHFSSLLHGGSWTLTKLGISQCFYDKLHEIVDILWPRVYNFQNVVVHSMLHFKEVIVMDAGPNSHTSHGSKQTGQIVCRSLHTSLSGIWSFSSPDTQFSIVPVCSLPSLPTMVWKFIMKRPDLSNSDDLRKQTERNEEKESPKHLTFLGLRT